MLLYQGLRGRRGDRPKEGLLTAHGVVAREEKGVSRCIHLDIALNLLGRLRSSLLGAGVRSHWWRGQIHLGLCALAIS
jgi:hypothetical protein